MSSVVYSSPARRQIKVSRATFDSGTASDDDVEKDFNWSSNVLIRWLFLRGVASIYLFVFALMFREGVALFSQGGIVPVQGTSIQLITRINYSDVFRHHADRPEPVFASFSLLSNVFLV